MSRERNLISAVGSCAIFLLVEWFGTGTAPFSHAAQPTDQSSAVSPASRPDKSPRARRTTPSNDATLLRELPRQALFIAASERCGLPACDRSVDFTGSVPALPVTCTVTFKDAFATTGLVEITGRDGKPLLSLDLPVSFLNNQYPDYAKVATTVEPWCDAQFATALSGVALQPKSKPTTTAPANGEVPKDVDSLLAQIDPQRAFLSAHLLHEAIAESGESPERLAALVRAYSQLAEATRYLYSAHGSAFFARAMIYAERLVRKHSDLPISYAARGYAYALLGQALDARRDFDAARKLAGSSRELPAWATLADELARFHTRALFDRVDGGPSSALASYFAMLTVEHSGLQSVVINMSRLALKYNPGSLRAVNIMTDNSGVGLQHETTAQSTDVQFSILASLASAEPVPTKVKSAAADAVKQRFAPPALLGLFDTMDQEPATPGQLLPWSTFASISRDELFVSGVRRLFFTSHMLGGNVSSRVQAWWPILKDHRFARVIGGFDRSGKLSGKDAVQKVRDLDVIKLHGRMTWMCDFVKNRTTDDPKPAWIEIYRFTSDDTVYDVAHLLWTYRMKEVDAIPFLSEVKGAIGESLEKMCPDHPSAVSEAIVNRWPETRGRAADIERDMGSHPQIAFALARAYRFDKRYDDAARLLKSVIEISPDPEVYEELADIYKDQGDVDQWLAVYNRYLSGGGEDFGLDRARKGETIAYTLMRMKRSDRALEYAKIAADSGSSWGYHVYAFCLTELGRYGEAEKVQVVNQERYPNSLAWYRWCQTTGKGDLKAAAAAAAPIANEFKDGSNASKTNEPPIFFLLEGDAASARAFWQREFQQRRDPYPGLQLAMLELADGKVDAAKEILNSVRARELPPDLMKMMGGVTKGEDLNARIRIYRTAIAEINRCLADPAAVPNRDRDLKMIAEPGNGPYTGCAAYFFGRVCELRGKKDDAISWYHASLSCGDWTYACSPQAAAGLRRLGEEHYK